MSNNIIRHSSQRIAAASLLLIGIGVSAAAFADGGAGGTAGGAGSTGGPAQLIDRRIEQGLAPATGETAYAAAHRTQDASGTGARNFVERERDQPAPTAISDEPVQTASGVGAHNRVDIGS